MQRLEVELQVPLFERQKNKIAFNENGRMAAEYAKQIVEQCQDMVLPRSRRLTAAGGPILVGSCAPVPLWEMVPVLTSLYPERTISSELRENDRLLQGLRDEVYQLIVLPFPVEEEGIACIRYRGRNICISPCRRRIRFPGSKGLYMKDLNGETMLLRNHLGFWREMTDRKMPDTRFLEQEDVAF